MQPRDVRVVERDVGVGRAADPDHARVQQVHSARVGPGHHVELGALRAVGGGVRDGAVQAEDGAVDERRLAEDVALRVEAALARVQGRRTAGVGAADGRGEPGGDRGERRSGGRGDEDVTAGGHGLVAAARPEDGQPDLHRRQRSLLRGARCVRPAGTADEPARPPTRHGASSGQVCAGARAPRPRFRTGASSHLLRTTRPAPADK
ncbi:hypothetical protein [Streptomyces globosus]|uniref:hypothetical protein n=1 Tax=Streptomyces globosus TaxID=68209 RepID=UPI00363536DE